MTNILMNLKHIHEVINRVMRDCQSTDKPVQLVAVSKYQPIEKIKQAIEAGQYEFAENRVQEAQEKWPFIRQAYPHLPLKLHLIGPLQTNKVKEAVALFDVIEVVDREKLAFILHKEMQKQNKYPTCYVQVNTGEEPQKAGILPQDFDQFMASLRSENFSVSGLMCIPPQTEEASLHFALLRNLAKSYDLSDLSMGMSADFEEAIKLGATHIRLGTAIFGERDM